jgi:deoxyadenosine/deoxycytidine kinase
MKNIISIEGNIGSGKTTLFNLLRSRPALSNVVFIEEPVDLWEKLRDDITGESLLQRFYADPERYAFAFQTMAFFSRLALLAEAPTGCTVVTERSLLTDRDVFAKMLHNSGKIDSLCYKIYLHNLANFSDVAPSKIIYIKTDPVICADRIASRNRHGESNISIDYLIQCEEYHEAMIRNAPSEILVLDGNQDGALRIMLNDSLKSIENFILQQ